MNEINVRSLVALALLVATGPAAVARADGQDHAGDTTEMESEARVPAAGAIYMDTGGEPPAAGGAPQAGGTDSIAAALKEIQKSLAEIKDFLKMQKKKGPREVPDPRKIFGQKEGEPPPNAGGSGQRGVAPAPPKGPQAGGGSPPPANGAGGAGGTCGPGGCSGSGVTALADESL